MATPGRSGLCPEPCFGVGWTTNQKAVPTPMRAGFLLVKPPGISIMRSIPRRPSGRQFTTRVLKALVCILAGAFGVANPAVAQLPGGGQAGWNAAMLKLFGDVSAFTSKAEIRLQEKGSAEPLIMAVDFAMHDGKVRLD